MVTLNEQDVRVALQKFAAAHPRKGKELLARFEALPPQARLEWEAPGLSVRIGLIEDEDHVGPHGVWYHRGLHPAIWPDGHVTFRRTGNDGVHYTL